MTTVPSEMPSTRPVLSTMAIPKSLLAHPTRAVGITFLHDYLSRGDIGAQIPITVRERMADSHFLFLGYSMRDWNLRVILRRIWGEQTLDFKSWSIQLNPDQLEREFWPKRNVDIYDVDLEDYVRMLEESIASLSAAPAGTG